MTQRYMALPGVVYRHEAEVRRYIDRGSWLDLTIGEALKRTAHRLPDRLAFASEHARLTFRELDERSDRLAGGLLLEGVQPGERAIMQMGTVLETVVVLTACFKAGVIPVCTLPQYREIEIAQLTKLSGATLHFVQADFSTFDLVAFAQEMRRKQPSLQRLVVCRPNGPSEADDFNALILRTPLEEARAALTEIALGSRDCALFQLSGGSTGIPKIIPRFHGEYLSSAAAWAGMQDMNEHSVAAWSLPLIHDAGMKFAYIPALLWGRSTVILGKTDIELLLASIERHGVTHAASVGPVAAHLLNYTNVAQHNLSSLAYFITMARADAVERHLAVRCANLYGLTEGLVMISPPGAPEAARHGTNGRPTRLDDEVCLLKIGTEEPCALGDIGELVFHGPSSLQGYYNAPELTRVALTSNGFVRSGDLAKAHRIDGELYYSFEGRLKDNINRGGEKFGTEEVETLAREHPAIADIAIVAMRDDIYFERACAYIISRKGKAVPSVAELGRFLAEKGLAKFKIPERIEIIETFPVTRVGKLDKAKLRMMINEQRDRERQTTTDASRQIGP